MAAASEALQEELEVLGEIFEGQLVVSQGDGGATILRITVCPPDSVGDQFVQVNVRFESHTRPLCSRRQQYARQTLCSRPCANRVCVTMGGVCVRLFAWTCAWARVRVCLDMCLGACA